MSQNELDNSRSAGEREVVCQFMEAWMQNFPETLAYQLGLTKVYRDKAVGWDELCESQHQNSQRKRWDSLRSPYAGRPIYSTLKGGQGAVHWLTNFC